jgi:hypothetical protein
MKELHLSRESGRAFHGNFRAPKLCRATIRVTHEDPTVAIAIEVGVGEGGAERVVQTITRVGDTELPDNVAENARVAFRVRQLPLGRFIVSVQWADPR